MAIDFGQIQYVDLGQRFMQGLQQARQVQQAQARAQQMQQDVMAWRNDMTPQRTADLLLRYPEIKDQITSAQSVLSDAAKQDRISFASKALMLARAGQGDRLKELATQRAGSYRAAGDEKMAQEIETQIKLYDLDPKAIEGALALDLAQADPNLYKTVFAQSDMTGFQKDLVAAGIDPNSPEGRAKAGEYVSLKTDPIVQMPTPTGGQFIGRQSEYYKMFGGDAPAPQVKAIPKAGEVKNGYRFNGGDPANKANWTKVGDAGSNASGGFRPSGN